MREFDESEKLIKTVVGELFNKPHLKEKYLSGQLSANWKKIVGQYIASKTASVQLKNSKLVLKLISAPLRQEIAYNKDKLIALVNDELGDDIVKEIKVL